MTEPLKGMDTVNDPIRIRDLIFSSQLGVGSAKWLEKQTQKPIIKFVEEIAGAQENMEVTKISLLLTALYLHAHPGLSPEEATAAVDSLSWSEMMEVFSRAEFFSFEPKNSPTASTGLTATAPSTGQPSSTS